MRTLASLAALLLLSLPAAADYGGFRAELREAKAVVRARVDKVTPWLDPALGESKVAFDDDVELRVLYSCKGELKSEQKIVVRQHRVDMQQRMAEQFARFETGFFAILAGVSQEYGVLLDQVDGKWVVRNAVYCGVTNDWAGDRAKTHLLQRWVEASEAKDADALVMIAALLARAFTETDPWAAFRPAPVLLFDWNLLREAVPQADERLAAVAAGASKEFFKSISDTSKEETTWTFIRPECTHWLISVMTMEDRKRLAKFLVEKRTEAKKLHEEKGDAPPPAMPQGPRECLPSGRVKGWEFLDWLQPEVTRLIGLCTDPTGGEYGTDEDELMEKAAKFAK